MSILTILGLAPKPKKRVQPHWDAPVPPKPPAKAKPVFKPLVIETPWYRLPVRSF